MLLSMDSISSKPEVKIPELLPREGRQADRGESPHIAFDSFEKVAAKVKVFRFPVSPLGKVLSLLLFPVVLLVFLFLLGIALLAAPLGLFWMGRTTRKMP